MGDEVVQPFGHHREAQDETVSRALVHPADDFRRHFFAAADKVAARGGHFQRHLAQGQAMFAGAGLDLVGGGTEAVATDIAQLREGLVQRVLGKVVVVEEAAQIGQRIVDGQQLLDDAELGFGLGIGGGHHRRNAGEDFHIVRLAGMQHGAGFHLAQEVAGFLDGRRVGKHRVGILAREANTGIGRTGLENHRLALRRAADVQRPGHLEETPLVVQRVQLVLVEELAGFTVTRQGVVVPAVPQALGDLQVFVGNFITQAVPGADGCSSAPCLPAAWSPHSSRRGRR
jgi:hypothetical protein